MIAPMTSNFQKIIRFILGSILLIGLLNINSVVLFAQGKNNENDDIEKLKEKNAKLENELRIEKEKRLAESTQKTQKSGKSPIVVSVGQPNVWTLEQAHYLLAQMHRRNLDLKTMALNNLDPNAINGVNIDILKTLLSFTVEFDESIGANNDITRLNNTQIGDEKQFVAEQRRYLLVKNAELQDSLLKVTQQIAEQKIKILRTDSEDEKKALQKEVDELTVVQEVVKQQITLTNQQLQTTAANDKSFGTFTTSKPSSTGSSAAASSLASLVNKISEQITNQPQLNASIRLDNYIQMQYEILSKQLTLLRDEVGPGERLIFMELPQSIDVSNSNTKNKLAQTWWKIRGYSECVVIDEFNQIPCPKVEDFSRLQNRMPVTTKELVNQLLNSNFNRKASYNDNSLYVQENQLQDLERIFKLLNDDNKTDFIKKLREEVSELKSYSTQSSQSSEIPTAFKTYADNYMESEKYYKACLEGRLTVDGKVKEDCILETEKFQKDRRIVVDFLLRLFKRFIDGELLEKYNNWGSFPKRVTNAEDALRNNRIESRFFRRIVLEEVFNGGIENWRDVWQRLIKLDDFEEKLKSENNKDDLEIWKNYEDRTLRIIDLFPKQNSLNVNDIKMRNNQFSAKGLFSLLIGIGGGGGYERTRERYSQFIQQELYSSAFGKGNREFGWTFYPMPGTDKLTSGVRTTFAVLIVPEETTALIFDTKGCYFPRSDSRSEGFNFVDSNSGNSKGCSEPKTLLVPLPNGGNPLSESFAVNKLSYRSVPKGGRAVISINGDNFSSQIGILINGVALNPAIGVGQPYIRDDSDVGKSVVSDIANSKIKGIFERISSREIIATFEMGGDYQGTPTITLVAPGTSNTLNSNKINPNLRIDYNNKSRTGELMKADYIFGNKVGEKDKVTTIESVDAFLANSNVQIMIKGKSLDVVDSVFANGIEFKDCSTITTTTTTTASATTIPTSKGQKRKSQTPQTNPGGTPNPLPSVQKCFTRDNKGYYISFPFEVNNTIKTIKMTLVTPEGTLDSSNIQNPAFNENPTAEPVIPKFEVKKDILAFTDFTQITCSTKRDKIEAIFELSGKGFTSDTKVYIDKKQQNFVFDNPKIILTIINPSGVQQVLVQDTKLEAQDSKPVIFKKPEKGCP